MSQNMGNKPGDSQGNSGRGSDNSQDRSQYQGFEGMNYEQIRQPYNPHRSSEGSSNDDSNNSGKRRDEL